MANTETKAQVFLIDDHAAVRQGLALVLEREAITICAQAESAEQAMLCLPDLQADLAVVDLSFAEGSGFELINALHAREIPVLVYSMHEDSEPIEHSFRAGASGYVSKREDFHILLAGVQQVLAGGRYVSPRTAQVLADKVVIISEAEQSGPRCSSRELQILALLGQGRGNSEIAETLALSVRTVETYCTRLCQKLALSGMKELRQFAIRNRGG